MSMKLIAASVLALGLAGAPAFAQSNPAPDSMTMDKNHDSNQSGTMHKKKTHKVDNTKTHSTNKSKTFNKENCASKTGKNSLQTQGGNSNTQNAEDSCADNNQ